MARHRRRDSSLRDERIGDAKARVTKGVTLTADTSLDFELPKIPKADLVWEGNIVSNPLPPNYGTWSFTGHGRNRGDGCAGQVSGSASLFNALDVLVASRAFTLPAMQ